MDVKWQDPPAVRRTPRGPGGGRWQKIAAQLRERPNTWALVGEDVGTSMHHYLRSMGLEVTTRGRKNGRIERIYARYVEAVEDV